MLETAASPAEAARQAGEFLSEGRVFALAGIVSPGMEKQMAEIAERSGVPVVAALPPPAVVPPPPGSRVFFVLSSLAQQGQALVIFARQHSDSPDAPSAVIYPESLREAASSILETCRENHIPRVLDMPYARWQPAEVASALSQQGIRQVFFLGGGAELRELLEAAVKLNWTPYVFQPGPLASQDVFELPPVFRERVLLAFPTLPSDVDSGALLEYQFLIRKHAVTVSQPALALSILASAKVLAEGLRQSGRQLSREGLVTALSGLSDFRTGLTPAVSFGPLRRIGALGAYVVKIDLDHKSFKPAEAWVTP